MTFPAPQSPQQTPQAPTAAQAPQAPQAPQPEKERPEAVSLMLKLWAGALGFEVIHRILNVVMTLLNRSVLFAEARKTAEEAAKDSGQEISDSLISIIGYGSVAFSSLISLVIIVVLAVMLYLLNKNKKSAGTGRRLWFAFSLFRTLLVFLSSPAGNEAPDWLIMVDGTVQILVGVAAVMGLIFSVKEETLDYTGELEEMRKLEQELAQERRDKERERREQERKELLEKQQKTSEHDAPRDSGRYDQEPRR
ncbi:hypothetical protein [Corynebacterium striatum]|uniref:hypothetical protein n=1 Tax=Corynebacterium striatum TaxID=43770 RepID=UPI0006661FB7|nr:hypothetical protein [Corynebacterium striatum]